MAENEQKALTTKKSLNSGKVPKHEKDAKEIVLGIKSKKADAPCSCKICKESGALLHCSHCPNSFHLICAKMKEADVPNGNWYCSKCINVAEKKLKDEITKHEKSERNSKYGKLKETLSVLNNFEKDKVVSKFGKKFPQFVKQGKINYPIEDTLLMADPEFHQSSITSLPQAKISPYPQESFLDIVSITAFVHTFSQYIGVSPFSIDTLYIELSKPDESHLIKEILMALTKELIIQILAKENLDEQLSGQNRFLYSASKLSSIFNILDYLPYSWLTLFSEIMTSNAYKDYTEETPVEIILNKLDEFPIETDFFRYSVEEKVSCITFLIACFCDTKVFHEALSERIDKKTELSREKAAIKVTIKELEQKQAADPKIPATTRKTISSSDKIQKLQVKIQELSSKIDDIQVRISPIGVDRFHNEYYIFKFDLTKVYLLKPLENTWFYFDTQNEIDSLISALNSKGTRESKLLESLKAKANLLQLESEESDNGDYFNRLSGFKDVQGDLATCRKMMLELEKKFTKYLIRSDKQWDTDENKENWKNLVCSAELLLDHYEKSSTPLRQTIADEFSDNSEEAEYEKKFRKVSIRIWQDFGDHNTIWVEQVKSASNTQQLILSIGIYSAVLENYVKKKNESVRNEEKKKPREDKRKKDGKKHANGVKHEDNCFFCDDGGRLICCEGCTRVVHPECIGFEKVPDEDWFCDSCNKTGVRVTRSRARLRKLNN
jgi:hypothetical protein